MAKLTLGKTVASVLVSSALALSVAIGVTAGQAYKKNSEESSYDDDRKDNPFENVNVQNVEKVADYGLISEYKIAFDDGTSSTFIVINGQNGPETIQAFPNDDGYTPKVSIGEDGKWIINEKETGLVADITNILEEIGPHIGENGNWWIGDVDTGTNAQGQPGTSPHVGENGNWYIGDTDTGVQAQGQNGKSAYELMQEQGYTGTLEEWLQTLKGEDGQDGKSAYEIMQEAGYTGTLEEWLDSLKGQDGKSAYELMQEADLLIIDDLGTEVTNPVSVQFLFDIVNKRTVLSKKMIISTNLTMDGILKKYTDRLFSRLCESFEILNFAGEDIRIQKLK